MKLDDQEKAEVTREKLLGLLKMQELINGFIQSCAKCRYWMGKRIPRLCPRHADVLKAQGMEVING